MKYHFCQNNPNEKASTMSFISGYFMQTATSDWPYTTLTICHFARNEISSNEITLLVSLHSITIALMTSLKKVFDFDFSMSGCTKLVTPSTPLRRRVGHFENWIKMADRVFLLRKGWGNSTNLT